MEINENRPENPSDSFDVVDGVTASCLKRKEEDSDGISAYHKRFNEEVFDSKNAKYDEYYSMDYQYKGYLLMFAHSKFCIGGCGDRNAELDVTVMTETFSKLDFEIRICRDQTLKEIKKIIAEVSTKNFDNYASLVIAISSHGKHIDLIVAKDDTYQPQEVLYEPFKENKTLFGKPKIFFLGACRGDRVDHGISLVGPVQTDSNALEEYRIPLEADILQVYATVQGYIAYHNPCKNGSHFFKYLTEALNENIHRDLLTILTIANNKIAINFSSISREEQWNNNKQCLCTLSTLTRKVRFGP